MIFPCPNPVDCPSTDSPLANLSSEAPDVARFFGFKFNPWGPQLCIADSEAMADICNPPPPFNPPLPVVYSSNAQSCTLDCGDGSTETYTAVTGTFVATSQAEADASAYALACAAAQILCNGGTVTLFYNTAQSCTVPCGNGLTNTYTLEAGLIAGLSLGEANTNAAALACTLATLLCAGRPPVPQGADGGAGVPPAGGPLFGNSQQSCVFNCAGGGTYNSVVAAGLFTADNRATANAIAASYACLQANEAQGCLGSLPADSCVAEYYEAEIEFTGLLEPVTWAIVSGSLPTGLLTSGGIVAGTPTATGASSFTMRATGADGNYSERSYTITAREILPSTLPNGDTSTPYAVALIGDGFTSPVWSVIGGALPDGLALNPNTGVISGTATTSGTFSFTIAVTEGSATCQKDFTIEIASAEISAQMWWTLDEVFPAFIDSASGEALSVNDGDGNAAGKIGLTVGESANLSPQIEQQSSRLLYTGTGMSWAMWFQRSDFGATILTLQIDYTSIVAGKVFNIELQYRSTGAAPHRIDVSGVGNPTDTVQITGEVDATGTWNLLVCTFDPADGKLRFSVNNGAFHETVAGFDLDIGGGGDVGTLRVTGFPSYFDEVAMYLVPLTAAQVAAIWNAGNGITWPTTIPA